ncbi:MAG: hypothetical protein QXX49_07695 [Candidatus Caldarchaeum sp.]|uniref:Uncharacterized protein n=1 Tax=Caldiarchaeum subterraneum TaxID=311458 RepID=A0A7J3VSS1_CALS0
MKTSEEKQLLESLAKIESYQHVFKTYSGYENRVLPGTITALGEVDPEEVKTLPGKNVLLVGVQDTYFQQLWSGFRGSASFILLTPLVSEDYDLWVIAVPMHEIRRVTWIVFPITEADLKEISKEPRFAVVIVPVERMDFDELTARVEDVIEELGRGSAFPSENGVILLVDLTTVFSGR